MTSAANSETGKLRIISLGGVDEIGKNMTVFEYGDEIVNSVKTSPLSHGVVLM